MSNIIAYTGEGEIIVAPAEDEQRIIKRYFTEGGRDLDTYTRVEGSDILLTTEIKVRTYQKGD